MNKKDSKKVQASKLPQPLLARHLKAQPGAGETLAPAQSPRMDSCDGPHAEGILKNRPGQESGRKTCLKY